MSNPSIPDPQPSADPSFQELLKEYEQSHARAAEDNTRQLQGTVIAVTADSVFVDIGYKIEGVLPLSVFQNAGEEVKAGDTFPVSIKGRNEEGYYQLSRLKIAQPTDWSSLERAFNEHATITGTVTGAVKGGLTVDVGVRAFMPASRSGVRDAAEMEKLVGQDIVCRIIKLDPADEDVVVDRRAVVEEEERATRERRYAQVAEGDIVHGTVRSLADYGAFVDVGGVDGLLHVSDISWSRIASPSDVLSVGQEIDVRVLKIDAEKQRISLGLKQLQPHPWDAVASKYKSGDRVRGSVTRVTEFGAFVEFEPGVEGLVHISEMSWTKKVRKVTDVVKPGDAVEVVVLAVNAAERRLSLGLKQALGDPWEQAAKSLIVGGQVEGPIVSMTKFGAFVQVAEGVEGMVHVSEISVDKHIHHPQDVLRLGEVVKAQVLAIDKDKRQLRLSIKQLVPTSLDEYLAEHNEGDVVTGRLIDQDGNQGRVELGEGIQAICRIEGAGAGEETPAVPAVDLRSLSSMLTARWKGGSTVATSRPEPARVGQIRSFKIAHIDRAAKRIELALD
jgi:small subunit ribosomal protein S1